MFYSLAWPDFQKNILIFKDWTHKKIFLKGQGFLGGLKENVAWTRNCCGWPSTPYCVHHDMFTHLRLYTCIEILYFEGGFYGIEQFLDFSL